ncbi:MAG TPA: alkaline phosphatase family protein [Acidimicrobiales bacterium]|nr:alkaline phosphatase family protein [Acidimicrobiales bacterium]
MPAPSSDDALDHVVVVMFENRSFDNLLGRLYEPGEVASFEGVLGKDLSNPIPEWAEHGADRGSVPYTVATSMNTPNPDPGEEYTHVNTQLFGIVDPAANRGVVSEKMAAPYNAPADPTQRPTMDGFVADYISAFASGMHRQPTYDEYAQIMTGYTPEQMPVLSALARGFATFDHWFCEVPSQTFTNRSFFHAGSSSGFVVNMDPSDAFPVHNTAETIFERLEANGLTWRVYCDPSAVVPFTGLIHAPSLGNRFENFFSTDQFVEDAAKGDLPTYSFIEPNLMQGHNDMHPAYDVNYPGMDFDPPSSLLGGEAFLATIYDAIRTSSSDHGSNVFNTLLVITFDEHGGTYDHVPPPLAPPPGPSAVAGQLGFTFERSGVRLPTIAISPWIDERTVVSDTFRATSVLATLRERWSLGQPFSAREAIAPTLRAVLSRDTPRPPETWPDVDPRPVPAFDADLVPLDQPLGVLAKAFFFGFLAFGKNHGQTVPDFTPDNPPNGAEALAIMRDLFAHLYPNLGIR